LRLLVLNDMNNT